MKSKYLLLILLLFLVGCSTFNQTTKTPWYHITICYKPEEVQNRKELGYLKGSSGEYIRGTTINLYGDIAEEAMEKLKKKAAKKGASRVLITRRYYKNPDFYSYKIFIEGIAYE